MLIFTPDTDDNPARYLLSYPNITLPDYTLPVICLSVKSEAAVNDTGNQLGFDLPANLKWL